ncbi:hypothetical protein PWEIH_08566 [Listeria weihenstephanensis FSL R9-0317]|uniref:DUF3139 domain-containing protein n=1 Tax=Listeria weihenstephanensis TaxID=1006155 RepID=A0A1S7FQF8_9LIST|nr:DUF3139 domain-containing protein [Listeria weihenstephanensis]AQY49627.1 hypothetical protein UE46_00130 [Listeria weihenstephanensis]EUJ39072.1 hypothetical protein PWEIH_08566 [Listeria weihenstephanensis FSL R9-0317]MBC1499171.1 DUF3139 domain-containing protein [Listeria weihenstephanensis]
MKKYIFTGLIIMVVGLAAYFTYQYYHTKNMAIESYEQYMKNQGVPKSDIKESSTTLNILSGNFETTTYYTSDPDYKYEYIYFKKSNETILLVYSIPLGGNSGVDKGMKYKILENE